MRKRIFDTRNWQFNHPGIQNYEIIFDFPIEFSSLWNNHINRVWADEKHVNDEAKTRITETISQLILEKKKKRFLSKYPRNAVRIRYLNKIFPNAIFINIVRDGRAVVASMIRRAKKQNGNYFGIPLKHGNQWKFDLLERHARQWVNVLEEINQAKNYLGKEQFFELKYEDFVLDPKTWLKKIFYFCNLQQQNVFQNPIKRVLGKRKIEIITEKLPARNELWKQEFNEEEIKKLSKLMKSTLEKFEYF